MSTKLKISIIGGVTFLIILGIVIGLSIYSVNLFSKSDLIASNITFNGVYIGDLTCDEAITLLGEETLPVHKTIKVVSGDKSFELVPSASGLNYDYEKIVENAFKKGREGNFFKKLSDIVKSRIKFTPVTNEYIYDSEMFMDTVDTLCELSGIDFKNLDIKLYENYANVKTNSDLTSIDYNKLYTELITAIETDEKKDITLPTVKIDKVTPKMVYDKIYVEPKNASVETIDGVTTLTPHTIGVIVEMDDINKALSEGKTTFNIPVVKKIPEIRVETLSGQLFSNVLGSFVSKYNQSIVGRTNNVTLAAKRINGVIINPGETFSYNRTLGPREASTGFSVATIYTSTGLDEQMGGGICQVSSNLYNAVLQADLKIVERTNHNYTVAYAKNGLDATVVYGALDFKFKNTLSSPVKIVASAVGGSLTVSLLGKKENNNRIELYTNTLASYPFETVEKYNPNLAPGARVVTQTGAMGYKVTATKVVKDSSGNVIRKESLGTSVYRPLSQIVEVGPEVVKPETTEETVKEEQESDKPVAGAEQEEVKDGGVKENAPLAPDNSKEQNQTDKTNETNVEPKDETTEETVNS